jgi:hypothetical protein
MPREMWGGFMGRELSTEWPRKGVALISDLSIIIGLV